MKVLLIISFYFNFTLLFGQINLSILILDKNDLRPMDNFNFTILSKNYQTNDDGRAFVKVLKGKVDITYNYLDQTMNLTKYISKDTSLVLYTTINDSLNTIYITVNPIKNIKPNSFIIDKNTLKFSTLPISTNDAIHLVHNLPGVNNSQEMNAGLNIRGNNAYGTSIYFNDVPMPNISHSSGLISIYNTDIIEKIEYFSSNLSSFYGNNGTSYLKFTRNKVLFNKTFATLFVSPLVLNLNSNFSVIKNKLGISISVRKSILEETLSNYLSSIFTNFNSIIIDAKYNFNTKNSFTFSVLNIMDKSLGNGNFEFMNDSNIYNYKSFSLRHEGILNKKWLIVNNVYFNYFKNSHYILNNPYLNIINVNLDFNAKSYISNQYNKLSTKIGVEFAYNKLKNTVFSSQDSIPNSKPLNSNTIFCDLSYSLRNWVFTLNQRFNMIYIKNDVKKLYDFRIGIENKISKRIRLLVALNQFVNAKHTLTSSLIASPFDYTFNSDFKTLFPQKTIEFLLGIYANYSKSTLSLTYFKRDFKNVYDYKTLYSNEFYFLNNIKKAKTYSNGLEFSANLFIGKKLKLDLNYTYSRTFNLSTYINNGTKYPANFDRPHKGNISFNYKLKKVLLSFNFIVQSGRPITLPIFRLFNNANGMLLVNGIPIYSDRNEFRLPLYHRLDVGMQFNRKITKKLEHTFNLHFYNAYAHQNVYGLVVINDYNSYSANYKYLVLFPFMPSFNYKISF